MTKAHFIREWRDVRRLTQQQLADISGYSKSTISMLENGGRELSFESLSRIAQALGISPLQLQSAPQPDAQDDGVPILGSVAANGESYHLWDYDPSVLTDRLPIIMKNAEMALPIKGDSMFPRFKDGEYAVAGPVINDASHWIGHDVVTRISDGRIVIKVLERCPTGRWTLSSVNPMYKRIEDVELDWIRPVISNVMKAN